MAHAHTHNVEGHERRLLPACLVIGGFMLAEVAGGVLSGSLAQGSSIGEAARSIKTLLHERFGIARATVEVEFGACADGVSGAHA